MRDFIKIFSLFAFTALMFVKISALHVYSHIGDDCDDEIENCASCEIAMEHQQSVLSVPEVPELNNVILTEYNTNIAFEITASVLKAIPSDFYSRPPPFIA